ncbi:ATP-binding protein [Burkholderia ubonensis]|uniref:IS21-like element ISBmu1 family helper ATPase IstB n=1 Tax=Burkholderia ubonensis TaxID=101571 RepID=UPI0007583F03|nr:IS21-like element ISBmu1 family helper ATPase IstB [Burkholderia ubonensis]KVN97967.1 ATP-binding protein [Burkholderia ubonensis]
MNPSPELNSILKQLRLSGILDSLEQRNRQAIDGRLAYTEFLAMLLHDEVARREHKKLGTRLLRAGFAMGKTLETFDFDRLPTLNRSHVHDLATGRYLDEKVAILIAGPTGTGKSHLAQALGHCAARQGRDVLFISQTELLKRLNAARATGAYDRKFQQYARVPLLIVDNFALKPLRTPQDEDFHDLVAARYEHVATILTSNLDFGEWGAAFLDNRILGTATLDRLRHGAYRLVLEGDSYRTPKPMPDPPQNAVAKNGKKRQP